ncbi:FAD-dependent oxidoreductase [Acidianus sp. RZ1]|uniref:FAD-dependent oxidoreductase n=1 Tax=Acidianus sp. RZ1 TaxID=1540082 RepID=UPI001492AD26|nr:FAD-dependent oxidoreductase [Acidianus sp. RZ1]NON62402.1 FAD-dependent oxidoreductase [Acidianus sp. RZ1]
MSFDADVVVVGGGLAGISAAITATREGLSVIVLERGDYSGSKNLAGGRMYIHALKDLVDISDAPLERKVEREIYEVYCGNGRKISFSYEDKNRGDSYTVLRAKFDQWFAKKAEEEGVLFSYSTLVSNARREKGGITLETNRGEVRAPLVIEADGVTAGISRYLGLRNLKPSMLMLGVKEVIGTTWDEGVVRTIIGFEGLKGGGFVYSNRDTLSIGLTVKVDSLQGSEVKAQDIVEKFREMIGIEGPILEYSAHLIPYYGYANLPQLNAENLIVTGDAAGFLINDGFTIRGMDLAIESGKVAGKAAKLIKDENYADTSIYVKMLEESFVMRDMKKAWKSFSLLGEKRIFSDYPKVLCEVLGDMFLVNGERRTLREELMEKIKEENLNLTQMVLDLVRFIG